MPPLHWLFHASAAAAVATGIALLVAADRTSSASLGHWGLLLELLAVVMVCVVVCDRYARFVVDTMQAENRRRDEMLQSLAREVIDNCNNQTRAIAEEASVAIMRMVNEPTARIY